MLRILSWPQDRILGEREPGGGSSPDLVYRASRTQLGVRQALVAARASVRLLLHRRWQVDMSAERLWLRRGARASPPPQRHATTSPEAHPSDGRADRLDPRVAVAARSSLTADDHSRCGRLSLPGTRADTPGLWHGLLPPRGHLYYLVAVHYLLAGIFTACGCDSAWAAWRVRVLCVCAWRACHAVRACACACVP